MRSTMSVVLLLGGSLAVAGCGPAINSTRFDRHAPRPADHAVLLYSTRAPSCPYEEVGLVSGRALAPWTKNEEVLEALRARAREMGGDAIVGLGETRRVTGGTVVAQSVSLDESSRLAGTVVRFTDPSCRE